LDLDLSKIKTGDTIFVKTCFLEYFFTLYAPKIKTKYILVTHNSDKTSLTKANINDLHNSTNLIAWFGVNPGNLKHPKFFPIPIGLANRRWEHGNIDNLNQVRQILGFDNNNYSNSSTSAVAKNLNLELKKYLACLNFSLTTGGPRAEAYQAFANQSWCKVFLNNNHQGFVDHKTYLTNMSESKFVICPFGHGLDTHRTWEALLVGCYPVVLSSALDQLYTDLPVVIVNSWAAVTQEFLEAQYNLLQAKSAANKFKWEKLYFAYWANLIRQVQAKIRS
ncbi:MAG TPA: hypothetical protein VJJ81_04070, partial [Candidatus Babeliales bacterium]|nr:hypothetical protein [Candidatus Babeliales bacterium]